MAYSVAGALTLLLLLHAAGVRLPPVVAAWQLIPPEELFELHEIFVLPTGADAGMDAVQHAMLAYSGYDWRALEFRRQRPWHGHDVDVAASVQQLLRAVAADWPEEPLLRDLSLQFLGKNIRFPFRFFPRAPAKGSS